MPGDSSLNISQPAVLFKLTGVNTTTIQIGTGKRLSFLEKIKLKAVQKVLKYRLVREKGEPTNKQRKQGELSMILGISSLVLLFVPAIGLLALPAAIIGFILGIISLKNNSNTKGIVGLITSSVTVLLFILAIVIIAALIAGDR